MKVSFYLYYPSESAANEASNTLSDEGYGVRTRFSADDANWLVW